MDHFRTLHSNMNGELMWCFCQQYDTIDLRVLPTSPWCRSTRERPLSAPIAIFWSDRTGQNR
ncbi:hypothetical protein RV420_360008 [Roseovarius sp. EC-SD190]|nr:hypothetical protein RV420_360008 [Roseovarius sp. EC-SD190]